MKTAKYKWTCPICGHTNMGSLKIRDARAKRNLIHVDRCSDCNTLYQLLGDIVRVFEVKKIVTSRSKGGGD